MISPSKDLNKNELKSMLIEIFDVSVTSKLDLDFLSISEKDMLKMLYDDIQKLKFSQKESFSAFEAYYDENRNQISRNQANVEWYNISVITRDQALIDKYEEIAKQKKIVSKVAGKNFDSEIEPIK